MERLTERTASGICGNNERVEHYPLYNIENDEHMAFGLINQCFEKLAEYEQAEEDGLLIRLPCPIGTTVYYAQKCQAPSCRRCLKFSNCYCEFKARIFEQSFDYRHLHAFGHSVFLTKAEAEQALAKMKGE